MRGSQGLRPVVGCLLHLVFRFYLGLPHGHSGEGGRGGEEENWRVYVVNRTVILRFINNDPIRLTVTRSHFTAN